MGRYSSSGPIKSTAGFEVGAGGSEATATHVTIIDSSGNITVPAGANVAGARPYALKADDYTITAAESGTVFGMATDAKAFTLPAVAEGLFYTFVNTGADDNNLIDIVINDGVIAGTFNEAAAVTVVSVATTIRNTKVGANKGDFVTLASDGVGWFIVASSGLWAQQAP